MRRVLAIVSPLLAILLLAVWRAAGPAPEPVDSPRAGFSAGRAMRTLEWLLDQELPHPTGTREGALMRSGIVSQFRSLGFRTHVQHRFVCNASGSCAAVNNVVAVLPEPRKGKAVALVAHYDSVPAGPGASDDAMGVAALLEVARAVKDEKFTNRVVFLVTDGEELGLLGAEAFMADPSVSRDVAVFLNVENRGTFGASNMFETSRGNRWLVRHVASALPRPQTSSFFSTIYDRMPNGTDLSVFKREGRGGLNFAAIRGPIWYHTPLDDLEHASPRTLQHHGENLLAMLRALGRADLDARSSTDAVYFDLLGFTVLWWPAGWTVWIAAAGLALLVWAARGEVPRQVTMGVLATFASVLAALAGGAALSWLGRLRSSDLTWVGRPGTMIAAMWLIGLAAAFASAALFRRRAGERPMLYGAGMVWHVIAIALAMTLPGASFLFLVPALGVTLAALLRAGETTVAAVASSLAAIVMFPLAIVLYDTMGGPMLAACALVMALVATLFAPVLARTEYALAAAIVAIVSALAANAIPAADATRPRAVSLSWVDDPATTEPQWVTTALAPALERAAPFKPATPLYPGARAGWSAPAPGISVPRVQLTASRNGDRVTVRIRSSRRSRRLSLLIDAEVSGTTVNGVRVPSRPAGSRSRLPRGWSLVRIAGVDGATIEFDARRQVRLVAADTTFELPGSDSGQTLVRARDAIPAVPVHDGDVTITRSRASV